MAEPMEAMKRRFQVLRFEYQDALRSLKLLESAGVIPYTHRRFQIVVEHMFRHSIHLVECLNTLAEQGFLRHPAIQDPIKVEPAYLRHVVTYTEGKTAEEDFTELADELDKVKDSEGLASLGLTFGSSLKDYDQALLCFERAIALRPDYYEAWGNKGVALDNLKRYDDALEAYEKVIDLQPNDPRAWYNIGVTLRHQERFKKALEAFETAIALKPDYDLAWNNKGVTLGHLDRYDEALEAYEKVINLQPNDYLAWNNKGVALDKLGRNQEALKAFEKAKALELLQNM
jgi:tetratricopeptide (TPR) repeat protein